MNVRDFFFHRVLSLITAILFEDAILLGAENDTTLYTSNPDSAFSLPFNVIERTVRLTVYVIQVAFAKFVQ